MLSQVISHYIDKCGIWGHLRLIGSLLTGYQLIFWISQVSSQVVIIERNLRKSSRTSFSIVLFVFQCSVCGSDASVEWECEGRRVVPLMPRLVPQTAFTGTATAAANRAASVNATISSIKGTCTGEFTIKQKATLSNSRFSQSSIKANLNTIREMS